MSLLKQAIVDAANLKEAALKNAEQMILEKYSNEIKTAVDSLLEQEDPLAAGGDAPPAEGDPAAADPAAAGAEEQEPTTFEKENTINLKRLTFIRFRVVIRIGFILLAVF